MATKGAWMAAEAPDEQDGGSDRALWRRLREADQQAFAALFHRYSDAVYNFAFRRTASWSAAEDVVQATFTSLWRRALAGTVDELRLDSARPLLLGMAGNECSTVLPRPAGTTGWCGGSSCCRRQAPTTPGRPRGGSMTNAP
jgi:Sigma-70 region 2